ncbi:MAG: phosphodiester glycosidase family protein [Armatimonadetes bacterium]|nr:phosphodiester glycosidase family protein [Armatimonadota bacterium]
MTRLVCSLLILTMHVFVLGTAFSQERVSYAKRVVLGVPVHIVTVNLNSPHVRISPALARHGVGSSEGFGSMLSRLQPTAAITGTFFCMKSLLPVGDIVIDSNRIVKGTVGTGLCFGPDNRVDVINLGDPRSVEWSGYTSVICSGPRLVTNGVITLYPRSEGFYDRALFRKARRSAIGVTQANKLLMVTVNRPIYLSKLAQIMQRLGAVDAINLDGGTSTALYFKGRVPSHPGRSLTNLIVVYESPEKFAKVKAALAPTPVVASRGSRS